MSNIVQYIIVRSDLRTVLNWPLGAVIAQTCHATAAVLHMYHDDVDTLEYFKNLDDMHKVVLEVGKYISSITFNYAIYYDFRPKMKLL